MKIKQGSVWKHLVQYLAYSNDSINGELGYDQQ